MDQNNYICQRIPVSGWLKIFTMHFILQLIKRKEEKFLLRNPCCSLVAWVPGVQKCYTWSTQVHLKKKNKIGFKQVLFNGQQNETRSNAFKDTAIVDGGLYWSMCDVDPFNMPQIKYMRS